MFPARLVFPAISTIANLAPYLSPSLHMALASQQGGGGAVLRTRGPAGLQELPRQSSAVPLPLRESLPLQFLHNNAIALKSPMTSSAGHVTAWSSYIAVCDVPKLFEIIAVDSMVNCDVHPALSGRGHGARGSGPCLDRQGSSGGWPGGSPGGAVECRFSGQVESGHRRQQAGELHLT